MTQTNRNYEIRIEDPGTENFFETFSLNARFELKTSSFGIKKVLANFQSLIKTEAATRQKDLISIYISFDEARVLIFNYERGLLQRAAELERQKAASMAQNGQRYYMKPVYQVRGGTTAEKLAARGKTRPDGCAEYRSMTIVPGNKKAYILSALSCAGVVDDKGLINPKKDANGRPLNAKNISIGIDEDTLKSMVTAIEHEMIAYRTAQLSLVATKKLEENMFNALYNLIGTPKGNGQPAPAVTPQEPHTAPSNVVRGEYTTGVETPANQAYSAPAAPQQVEQHQPVTPATGYGEPQYDDSIESLGIGVEDLPF